MQNQPDQRAPSATDALAEGLDFHERFMESRLRVYVGREQINDALTAFVEKDEPVPCLVTGPSDFLTHTPAERRPVFVLETLSFRLCSP